MANPRSVIPLREPTSCFCGINVRTGTLLLGYYGAISAFFGMTSMVKASLHTLNNITDMCLKENWTTDETTCHHLAVTSLAYVAVEEAVRGVTSILLIIGVKSSNPCLMIPFMIFHGVITILMGFVFISMAVFFGISGNLSLIMVFAIICGMHFAVMGHLFRVMQACRNQIISGANGRRFSLPTRVRRSVPTRQEPSRPTQRQVLVPIEENVCPDGRNIVEAEPKFELPLPSYEEATSRGARPPTYKEPSYEEATSMGAQPPTYKEPSYEEATSRGARPPTYEEATGNS